MRWVRAVAVLVGVGVAAGVGWVATRPPRTGGLPDIGGPFALTDGAGHRVNDASYRGFWRLVYFGYTHCPDACPTTLGTLGAALDRLPAEKRAHVRVLFVTVDPARDSPAVIGAYAAAFGREFVGLTGNAADLAPVEAEYHVYVRRHDLKGGDYAMDHSSIIYVMGPDGSFVGLLDDGLSADEMARRLAGFGA